MRDVSCSECCYGETCKVCGYCKIHCTCSEFFSKKAKLQEMKIKFKDFMRSRESGKFLVNPYWIEYLINLFTQGYYDEFMEEIEDTKANFERTMGDIICCVLIASNQRKAKKK